MSKLRCPSCGSENIAPAEKEYAHDYPFWMVLAAVFILLGVAFLLFFLLQLHPVLLILILVAAVSKLLDAGNKRRQKSRRTEYICLNCETRFSRRKSGS
jgi:DNA-directed RNA polymerase subunit RPC12/RpoP